MAAVKTLCVRDAAILSKIIAKVIIHNLFKSLFTD